MRYERVERGEEIVRGTQLYCKESRSWENYWSRWHKFIPGIRNIVFDPKTIRRPLRTKEVAKTASNKRSSKRPSRSVKRTASSRVR